MKRTASVVAACLALTACRGGSHPAPAVVRARDASVVVLAARADAAAQPDSGGDVYVPAVPPGPTGTIEGTVYLDGPIRRGTPVVTPPAFDHAAGCHDAAVRYAQPFDIAQPGLFPGVLVSAEARESSPAPSIERRFVFRDCDIVPRVMFATERDRFWFHPDTHMQHLPHITGTGATIDRLLIPGQSDVDVHVAHPGRYPIMVRNLPAWVTATLYVLPNRFIDTTDLAGHFRITDVPVGNITVHAWYPGAVESRQVVAVVEGQAAHAEFHLHQSPVGPAHPLPDAGPGIP